MERANSIDRELIAEAIRREGDAWTRLYIAFAPIVTVAVRKFVRNPEDVEDISQTTWLRAMKHIHELNTVAAFPGWIQRIAVNEAKQHCRSSERRSVRHLAYCNSADQPGLSVDVEIDIARATAHLPSGMAEVARLVLSDYDLIVSAAKLGIAYGTAKSQMHKARGRLKHSLSDYKPLKALQPRETGESKSNRRCCCRLQPC